MLVVAAGLPGLEHHLEEGHPTAPVLAALRSALPGAVLEGDRVVGQADLEQALALAAQRIEGLGIGVAVAGPADESLDGHPLGVAAQRARQALVYAREGEVLVTPAVGEVPDGVGVFEAPAVLSVQLKVPMRMLRDYR